MNTWPRHGLRQYHWQNTHACGYPCDPARPSREIPLIYMRRKSERKMQYNRLLVSGKYIALQIFDDEDVETMIESFRQQEQMSVLELYIEKDVAGGSAFHSANSVRSYENNFSNNESEPPRNISNLHEDEDEDDDDDDYLVSNSYVEDSLEEDNSVDGISDTDDEVADMVQPVTIVQPRECIFN
ncbi:hypothetical protein GmHk_14G040680 [Glycine max]|nr:hypothetical protein GmHk_14G040680 [Glycine max]